MAASASSCKPEEYLHRTGIALIAKRCQVVIQARTDTTQWLEYGDTGKACGRWSVFSDELAKDHGGAQGVDATGQRQHETGDTEPGSVVSHQLAALIIRFYSALQ